MSEVPLPIQKGLKFASIDGVQLIGTPSYVDNNIFKDKWGIEVELRLNLGAEKMTGHFPQYSRWFVVLDHSYPYGNIDIYPSKTGGINETYPHQEINTDLFNDLPWRTGKICIDKPIQRLGLIAGHHDPVGDYEERIRWSLQRALAWIRAAATDSLVQRGDPFETPYYLCQNDVRYVHDESNNSFSAWKSIHSGEWGYVIWDSVDKIANTEFAVAYFGRNGDVIRITPKYNELLHILNSPETKIGLWWYWSSPIVLPPFQAPTDWGELRKAGKAKRVQVDQCLRSMTGVLRGRGPTPLMLGYPIPKRFGEEPCEIHWQTIKLENILPLSEGKKKPPRGFRSFEKWQWYFERTKIYSDKMQLKYLNTENWHPDRLQARGRLSQLLREAKIVLIGCGALGSSVAELLARGGVENLLFIDPENLEAGNLVRHTLSGQDIGEPKASVLAKKLTSSAPFANIKAIAKKFPVEQYEVTNLLEDYDIVIDCTAEDEVIHALSLGNWNTGKLILSASVGYRARRTYLFSHFGLQFPLRAFQSMLEPLLKEERSLWADDGETIEGAGCWSPLFPARMDDLLLSACSTIKVLEELVEKRKHGSLLVIFEQDIDGDFQGLKRTDLFESKDGTE